MRGREAVVGVLSICPATSAVAHARVRTRERRSAAQHSSPLTSSTSRIRNKISRCSGCEPPSHPHPRTKDRSNCSPQLGCLTPDGRCRNRGSSVRRSAFGRWLTATGKSTSKCGPAMSGRSIGACRSAAPGARTCRFGRAESARSRQRAACRVGIVRSPQRRFRPCHHFIGGS